MLQRKTRIIVASLALVSVGLLAVALRFGHRGAVFPARITLYVTGDSRGYLEPCGCRRDQAGGLAGRATLIGATPTPDRVVLDVGNLTSGGRPYELLKLGFMMDGMAKIGYDAVNIGRTEAELDRNTLGQITSAHLPFLSANVLDRRSGSPIAAPYRIIKRGKLRIGVTGVTYVALRDVGPGVDVTPPLEALAAVIPRIRPLCDYLVVLAFVDADTIHRIADQFPEVDCILGGDVPQSSNGIEPINRAIGFNVMDRGKVLGKIELKRVDGKYVPDSAHAIKVMGEKLKPDPAMTALIAQYKAALRDKRYELASAEGMERIHSQESTADEFVGQAACVSCHANAHKVALTTAHAHAFQTLVNKGSEYDPECLKCHTVGYGLYSGFVDATRTSFLENVQCESCHGRGKLHIAAMQTTPHAKAAAGTLKPVTPASCVRCHDTENSENFRYATFWPKIAH